MSNVIKITTPPTGLVITLIEAKEHLHVTHTEEDLLITALINAATKSIEHNTNRPLLSQGWTMYLDSLPACGFYLPRSPLISVDSIKYFDTDSVEQTVDTSVYKADQGTLVPSKVTLKNGQSWPSDVLIERGAVAVTFTAGYGAAVDVPEDIKAALKLLLGHWHENREEVVVGFTATKLPSTVKYLLDPHRIIEAAVNP